MDEATRELVASLIPGGGAFVLLLGLLACFLPTKKYETIEAWEKSDDYDYWLDL